MSYRNATLNDAQTIVHFLLEMAKVKLLFHHCSKSTCICHSLTLLAHSQESENVKLDQPTVERAVEIVLQTPSKGEYFVAEVLEHCRV